MFADWNPDWTLAPGALLRDWADENHLPHSVAARVCGMWPSLFRGILTGSVPITEPIAAALNRGTGITASFWLNYERRYRADLKAGRIDRTNDAEIDRRDLVHRRGRRDLDMGAPDRWNALVDDAVHEINMRWGVPVDDSAEPDTDPMDQVMVRETAEAILRPVEAEVERLRAALRAAPMPIRESSFESAEKWDERYDEWWHANACEAALRGGA